MKVKLTFTESILGTLPNDKEIAERFIASKAPDAPTTAEEVEAVGVDAVVERGMTVFPRLEDGTPFIYDYQIRGFFKAAASAMAKVPGSKSSKIKAFKKTVDTLIFVDERKIPIEFDGEIGNCQRPLRASTPQGERVSLANSEEIAAGATIAFNVTCLNPEHEALVEEWLGYGKFNGLGQWRNGSHGRFTYELL